MLDMRMSVECSGLQLLLLLLLLPLGLVHIAVRSLNSCSPPTFPDTKPTIGAKRLIVVCRLTSSP